MGLSGQAFRLLKCSWEDPQLLAEEMYLILLTDQDSVTAPTSVQQGTASDPTRLPPGLANDPIPDLNLPVLDFPVSPDNPFDLQQGPSETLPSQDTNFHRQRKEVETTTQHTRSVVPGKVGTGSQGRYNVTLYPNSSQASQTEAVEFLEVGDLPISGGVKQLDGALDVPAGTWTMVFRHTQWEIKTTRVLESGGGIQGEKEVSKSVEVRVVARHHEMQAVVQSSSSIPAVVTDGSGNSYTLDSYPQGLAAAPVAISATQLQIDPGAQIPAGTWCFVARVGGIWYMQVPVWI